MVILPCIGCCVDYNTIRLHSALGSTPPATFAQRLAASEALSRQAA